MEAQMVLIHASPAADWAVSVVGVSVLPVASLATCHQASAADVPAQMPLVYFIHLIFYFFSFLQMLKIKWCVMNK